MTFVTNLRGAWKLWSVKFAAIVGVVVTILTANTGLLLGLIGYLPDGPARYLVASVIGFLAFGLPTLLRVIQQFDGAPPAPSDDVA